MVDPLHYHRDTKHSFKRFAKSPGRLDWQTQPDPFRRYSGALLKELPLLDADPTLSADHLFTGALAAVALTLANIAGLLELSLGLSCWKEIADSRWALRMNPSSGNLHPTESYLVLPAMDDLDAGVYHYSPFAHGLERRLVLQDVPAGGGFFLALSSVFWRESWKYGERAFRYCNHDAGHAAAAIRFAANLFGWSVHICAVGDQDIASLLGFNRTTWPEHETEHPDMLLWVGSGEPVVELPVSFIAKAAAIIPEGKPNILSSGHHLWDQIEQVAAATVRSGQLTTPTWEDSALLLPGYRQSGAAIIRQRRSAVDTDRSQSKLSLEQFRTLLDTLLPRRKVAPFDLALGESRVHLVFFVHNVEGLKPGLYIQIRNQAHYKELQDSLREHFLWQQTTIAPSLYLLEQGDLRNMAAQLSCGQEICGNGALTVAMLARFSQEIAADAGRYRELFWESGMIGQVLYLQAEMCGQSGTGIGCYFDDPVHQVLGISDASYQSMYHFTLGHPLIDARISSREPYFHLNALRSQNNQR